jgi:hypothetical protein
VRREAGALVLLVHLRSVERRPARDMTGRGGRGEPGHHPLAVPSSAIPGGVRLVAVAVSVVIGVPVIPAGSLNGPDERGAGRAGRLARARGNGGWAAGELVQAITVEVMTRWWMVLARPVLAPGVSTAATRCAGLGRHGGSPPRRMPQVALCPAEVLGGHEPVPDEPAAVPAGLVGPSAGLTKPAEGMP